MTVTVESPPLFVFHSSWSKCTLVHSWSKLGVQARTVKADQWAVAASSFSEASSPLYTQYKTQPFHNTWISLFFFWASLLSAFTYHVKDLSDAVFISECIWQGQHWITWEIVQLLDCSLNKPCSELNLYWWDIALQEKSDLPQLVRGAQTGSTI